MVDLDGAVESGRCLLSVDQMLELAVGKDGAADIGRIRLIVGVGECDHDSLDGGVGGVGYGQGAGRCGSAHLGELSLTRCTGR
ncbi:MAG: hypothetical protein GY847_35795 [Proteobacteria bacterium]|nr:hypothetical protein [Pseudomonadota bacterium]